MQPGLTSTAGGRAGEAHALYARRRAWLLLPAAVLLLADLQSFPIELWDESRRVVNAMEMRAHGWSLVTTYGGVPDLWNTKPPLLIWLMNASMGVLGPSEFALRLPSGLATLGSVALTVAFTWRVSRSAFAAPAAGFILLTSRGFVGRHTGQTADYDALLCLFTTAYAMAFHLGLHRRRPGWRLALATGALVAAAVLSKGVAGLVPGAGVGLYLLVRNRWRRPLQPAWVTGGLLATAVVAGFYGLREAAGPGYLAAMRGNELGRYAVPLAGHARPVWFYFAYVFAGFGFSLGPFALPLLAEAPRLKGRRRDAMVFCLCMTAGVIGAYTVGQTRIRWYAAPAYPFLAVACALGLEPLLARAPPGLRTGRLIAVGAAAMLVVIVAVRDLYPQFRGENPSHQYGRLFARLHDLGVKRVLVVDGGVPNDERNFPAYAPQLDAYSLIWRERGMEVVRVSGAVPLAAVAGAVAASCDPIQRPVLASHGAELFRIRGCRIVRIPGQPALSR